MKINKVNTKSILNPTGGFLSSYTHTINPYHGCQLGLGLCGSYCYARAVVRNIKGETRAWGTYLDAKVNAASLYREEYNRIRNRNQPLRIFMSSVTDPYVPVEKELQITKSLLEAMIELPPDSLVIQTHTPNVLQDLTLLKELDKHCKLSVQISVETDMENSELGEFNTIVNFRHVYSVRSRLGALSQLKKQGLHAVAVISPLLPLKNIPAFARSIDRCSNYAILDHFLIGDGSYGSRTSSHAYFDEPLPEILRKNGYTDWNSLEQFYRVVHVFETVMGKDRVGVSKEGFNRGAT
jgi:DNA repair photolyase